MMFYSPFFRYPYRRSYWQPQYTTSVEKETTNIPKTEIENETKKEETRGNMDSPFIELFGISLYFDDILIVCLLLFLFEEGVDDEWLYIALILLLFS